jgi:hypothetical protein
MSRGQGFAVQVEALFDVRMDFSGDVTFPVKNRWKLVFDDLRPARRVHERKNRSIAVIRRLPTSQSTLRLSISWTRGLPTLWYLLSVVMMLEHLA